MGAAARSEAPGRAHSPDHHPLHPRAAATSCEQAARPSLGSRGPLLRRAEDTAVCWAAEDALWRGRRETPRSWAETAGQTNGCGEGETTEENQRLEDWPEHRRDPAVGLGEVPWAESTGTQNPAGPTGGCGGPGPARGWGGRRV